MSTGQTDDDVKPWERPLSHSQKFEKLSCSLSSELSIVLANRIYIEKKDMPSQLLNKIKRLAAFQNPEFYKKQSMRLSTALTPRVVCCSETIEEYLTIPRGCLEDLEELCSVNNILLAVEDKRFRGEKIGLSFRGELTEDQKKAVSKIMECDQGVFVAPPGIGKTVIGINIIAARGVNTLVLVHRKPLLEQWRSQIASFLDMPINEEGQIGGGKDKITSFIDVAMIQSLDRHIDSRIRNYGQIIVDECHHISAFSFEKVMMEANAKYITGLTATPYRRDGHQPIITMQCGPVRCKISNKNHSDSLISHRLVIRPSGFSCSWSESVVLYEGKSEVRIYDYVDTNIPVLVKMHKKRLKAYKALGYEEAKAF